MTSHVDHRYSESAYQAERAAKIGDVGPTPEYIIERYRRCRLWRLFPKEFVFKRLGDITGKEILDFGCGEGVISTQLARLGGRVTAIDISPQLIDLAKRRADLDGVRDCINFVVADITESPFPKNKFDSVICSGALHHVDLRSVMPHLLACLKPGGVTIMLEPIAFAPLLQRYRDMLPIEKDASPGERQLNRDDVKFIVGWFDDSQATFFNLFGRLARLFQHQNKIDKGHPLTKTALVVLTGLDRLLVSVFPGLSRFCGIIVIVGWKRVGSSGPDDPAAIVKAVTGLLEDPQHALHIARCARQEIEQYTWASVREAWAAVSSARPA